MKYWRNWWHVYFKKRFVAFFQWAPRSSSKRGKVFSIWPCTPGPGQGCDELHAPDEVHVQQLGRYSNRASLQEAQSQLTISAFRILTTDINLPLKRSLVLTCLKLAQWKIGMLVAGKSYQWDSSENPILRPKRRLLRGSLINYVMPILQKFDPLPTL